MSKDFQIQTGPTSMGGVGVTPTRLQIQTHLQLWFRPPLASGWFRKLVTPVQSSVHSPWFHSAVLFSTTTGMAAVLQGSTSFGLASPRLLTPRSPFFGLSTTKPLSSWISLSRKSSSSVRTLVAKSPSAKYIREDYLVVSLYSHLLSLHCCHSYFLSYCYSLGFVGCWGADGE